jgi:hypothetical protein
MRLNDTLGDRKAKPGTAVLGREERIEGFLSNRVAHPGTPIGDRNAASPVCASNVTSMRP